MSQFTYTMIQVRSYIGWTCSFVVSASLTVSTFGCCVDPMEFGWINFICRNVIVFDLLFLGSVSLRFYKWWKRPWIVSLLPIFRVNNRIQCIVIQLPKRKY